MLRIAAIPRIIHARLAGLALQAGEPAARLPDANAGAIGAAVLRVAAIARVVDAGQVRVGARLAREAGAGRECRTRADR